jgi:hypothetical protein
MKTDIKKQSILEAHEQEMRKTPKYQVNTILHTKDGRLIGNAIIVGHKDLLIEGVLGEPDGINILKTDYGHEAHFDDEEIREFFHPPVYEVEGKIPGESHKYYVPPSEKDLIFVDESFSHCRGEAPIENDTNGFELLSFLLEQKILIQCSDQVVMNRTVGELVLIALLLIPDEWQLTGMQADAYLRRLGIKVRGNQLIVDINCVMLHDILKSTPWEKNYSNALFALPGCKPLPHEFFSTGIPKRAIGIPGNLLFKDFITEKGNEEAALAASVSTL